VKIQLTGDAGWVDVRPDDAFKQIVAATGEPYCTIKVEWTRQNDGQITESAIAYAHNIGFGEQAKTVEQAVETLIGRLAPDVLRKEAAELRARAAELEAKAEKETVAA
jgi:hypothetical protein